VCYNMGAMITFADLNKLEIRVGKIMLVEDLPNPHYATHQLTPDFGAQIGVKISCARLTNYSHDQLLGKLIIGVVNLPSKHLGKVISEVLLLGTPDTSGDCILICPDSSEAVLGERVY
jgi:tRNA-binding protein